MYYYDDESHLNRGDPYGIGAPQVPQAPGVGGIGGPSVRSSMTDTERSTNAMRDLASATELTAGMTNSKGAGKLAKAASTISAAAALFSDKNAKRPMYSAMETKDVVPIGPDAGGRDLQMTPQGRAFYVDMNASPTHASFAGPASVSAASAPEKPPAKAKAPTKAAPKYRERELSPEEQVEQMRALASMQFAAQPLLERTARYEDMPLFSDDRAKLEEAERSAYAAGRAHQVLASQRGMNVSAYGWDKDHAQINDKASRAIQGAYETANASQQMDDAAKPQPPQPKPQPARNDADLVARGRRAVSDAASRARSGGLAMAGAMADARRAMAPSAYSYKEEYRPPEQAPGEVNVGPMAQNMAKDPVASTAVRQDPQSGMLTIDRDKALKLVMGSLADLQSRMDMRNPQR